MSSQEIKYLVNKATEKEILAHFNTCDENFLKNLKEKVDLQQYSKKLFEKSIRFEAWQDNKLVGLVAGYFNDQKNTTSFISNVSVNKDKLNQGIASSLVKNAIEYGRDRSFKILELEVSSSNNAAIKLYEKFGFVTTEQGSSYNKMRLSF
jgi:ribosomal protein S18 acetylase RimI-like enzyme